MWIVMQDGAVINTDQMVEIRPKGSRIIAHPAGMESAAFRQAWNLPINEYLIADLESPKAAEEEYVMILSALETGDRVYHVGGSDK